jgi:hypothetical protein
MSGVPLIDIPSSFLYDGYDPFAPRIARAASVLATLTRLRRCADEATHDYETAKQFARKRYGGGQP